MPHNRSRRAAAAEGPVPTIACFNHAKTPLGVDLSALIAALQKFLDLHFVPVWGTPARLVKSTGFLKGAWAMGFFDDSPQASIEGYHDVTPEGLPLAKVFVKSTLANKDLVSVCAAHELAEMLVDPAINLYATGPKRKSLYDYESADPVEELTFNVDGIPMSDFVYPAYFEHFRKPGSTRFDHMGVLDRPFQIDKGGYQGLWRDGKDSQLFGSIDKKRRFGREDRRGHRSTFRHKPQTRVSTTNWGRTTT